MSQNGGKPPEKYIKHREVSQMMVQSISIHSVDVLITVTIIYTTSSNNNKLQLQKSVTNEWKSDQWSNEWQSPLLSDNWQVWS